MSEIVVYHGATQMVQTPLCKVRRPNLDFGQGFYLTPDKDFTFRWAGKDSIVNEYELNLSGLDVMSFTRSLEWFQYIFDNRRTVDSLSADVIIGPIANDTIYDTLGILSSGYLSSEEALQLLLIGPEYIQVAVKSERALSKLRWMDKYVISENEEMSLLLQEEQENYQDRKSIKKVVLFELLFILGGIGYAKEKL